MKLEIVFLYHDLMNIYGDRGNIITLQQRCKWRGIEANVHNLTVGDKIDPDRYDFYFFGGGQDKEQYLVADDLTGEKGQCLREAAKGGAVFLTVCGGYQMLGHYYRPDKGPDLPGLGILDVHTVAGSKRCIGNVIVQTEFGSLVAFENHSGKTYLGSGLQPLGRVLRGAGNNGEDGFEGVAAGNVFGTYLHGSLLPKNPHFADLLLSRALRRRGISSLEPLDDAVEMAAHRSVRLKQ